MNDKAHGWLILLRDSARLICDVAIDFVRYTKYARCSNGAFVTAGSSEAIAFQVAKDVHRIEKGLALPSPKRPFGAALQQRLDSAVSMVRDDAPRWQTLDEQTGREALKVWNSGGDVSDAVAPPLIRAEDSSSERACLRHSVRSFDKSRAISLDLVDAACARAARAPSVCNRQPWSVSFFNDPEQIHAVLSLQNGNGGFGDTVPLLAVVFVDLRAYGGPGERHQAWMDGGIFTSELDGAFFDLGVESCILNWSMRPNMSRRLRRLCGIGDSLEVVSMIALGYPARGARVTRSTRKPLDDLRTIGLFGPTSRRKWGALLGHQ